MKTKAEPKAKRRFKSTQQFAVVVSRRTSSGMVEDVYYEDKEGLTYYTNSFHTVFPIGEPLTDEEKESLGMGSDE